MWQAGGTIFGIFCVNYSTNSSPHFTNTLYVMVSELYATLISCTVYVRESIEIRLLRVSLKSPFFFLIILIS
jgi:hypothetical protein